MRFSDIRQNLRKDYAQFPSTKIAILGDTPTQFLHQALKGCAYDRSLNPIVFEAGVDQIDRADSGCHVRAAPFQAGLRPPFRVRSAAALTLLRSPARRSGDLWPGASGARGGSLPRPRLASQLARHLLQLRRNRRWCVRELCEQDATVLFIPDSERQPGADGPGVRRSTTCSLSISRLFKTGRPEADLLDGDLHDRRLRVRLGFLAGPGNAHSRHRFVPTRPDAQGRHPRSR